jgi:hypothetical protein
MKVHIARDGAVLGEWTRTELYPLLRASELFEIARVLVCFDHVARKSQTHTMAAREILGNHCRQT